MPQRTRPPVVRLLAAAIALSFAPLLARAETGITYETETLDNGLQVIYAPMPTSPVTHVRVLYHVGSRDERPDRQGFAHMFEHMMFRGSEHVPPQVHMKLIGHVGGYSNAFTSFDQTVYVNTVPNNYTPLALWLEADRMSSFKVSPEIFHTERLVVAEEWRLHQNQPYGTMWEALYATVFQKHSYHWTPIGNMDQLHAAATGELQAFYNQYYIPNNAILAIAGNIDIPQTKKLVRQYFGWIPKGEPIVRRSPKEPLQTEPRRVELTMHVPLPRIVIAYHLPPIISPDRDAINMMSTILGEGQSSRLSRALVTGNSPLCHDADSMDDALEDGGLLGVTATVLNGKDPAAVEKILREQIAGMAANPVTPEELEKAKQQYRMALAERWETADKVAGQLGDELQKYGNLNRIPTARARLEAITAADIQRVAKTYFVDAQPTTLVITPGEPAAQPAAAAAPATQADDPVATAPPRKVNFPADYPIEAPMSGKLPAATFEKGTEKMMGDGNSVHVIVMEDHHIPVISWSLTFRQGGDNTPNGKDGLAGLTAQMIRRGPKGTTFDQFNDELESRGIELGVSDGGDHTQIGGSCLKEQFPFALAATHDILTAPAFDRAEFAKVKAQDLSGLRLSLNNPQTVAGREMNHTLYGNSPLGHLNTPETTRAISLEDIQHFFADTYHTKDAILMISGDISVADGQAAAEKILAGLTSAPEAKPAYDFPAVPEKRHIILVDRPDAKQSAIRLGIRAYDITNDQKYAGSLAGQMLSSGIDSRLGRYVRAEKGYVYGVFATFQPGREGGAFLGQTDTKCETTADTVEAMLKVFDDLKAETVSDKELADAKFRVAGQLLMNMQTVKEQSAQRVSCMLNGYPADYYDKYADRISQVTADEVKTVMNQYVLDNRLVIVVVAPAATVKAQLERLGPVEVVPMPDTN